MHMKSTLTISSLTRVLALAMALTTQLALADEFDDKKLRLKYDDLFKFDVYHIKHFPQTQ